jgi:protein-S-isoprenylcysteine O-methyltransferase Ste14
MILKSIAGIFFLFLTMALALFLSAGTWQNYEQGWWYLLAFFAGVLAITLYLVLKDKSLLQSRLKAGTLSETRLSQKIIQGMASLGFLGVYVLAGFDYRFQWSDMPDWLWIFSDVMILLTMGLMFIVFRANTFLSATVEVQNEQKVIENGPYAIVRHPMYSAAFLLFVFTPLALGSWWALLFLPVMTAVLMLRAIDEEKLLRADLNGYEAYCRKVRFRLIPYLW